MEYSLYISFSPFTFCFIIAIDSAGYFKFSFMDSSKGGKIC